MNEDQLKAKLLWRCRRGMKELDYLMQYYVNDCYFSASEAHREAFDSLLVMQDPDIYALVTNRTTNADKDIMHVIKVLTQYYKATT